MKVSHLILLTTVLASGMLTTLFSGQLDLRMVSLRKSQWLRFTSMVRKRTPIK